MKYCYNCGKPVADDDARCLFCGADQAEPDAAWSAPAAGNPFATAGGAQQVPAGERKNKTVAGLLAIFLGMFGVHKFYLGYKSQGLVMLFVTIFTFGIFSWVMEIVGIIEGIIYLMKSDQAFYETYEAGYKPWF